MKFIRLLLSASLVLTVGQAFAQSGDTETKRTTTETPEGRTTSETTEVNRDEGAGAGGFFVEPGLRYDSITGDINLPAPFGNSNVDAQGLGVNARVGFHIFDVMFVAAEANYSQLSFEEDATSFSSDGSAYSFGPTVGFQTPWAGVRIWGTYIADGAFNPSSDNGVEIDFEDQRGYKVGLGLRFAKFGASIEYQDTTYESVDVNNFGGGNIGGLEMQNEAWIGSISFPISL